MSRNYDLDPTAAKEANSGGKRITEPGPYVGTFRAAFYEKNDKGTESVNLIFEAENGQEVGPLALYTHNGKGEPLPSYKTLNALMACMKVRKLDSKKGNVSLYDFDSGKVVVKQKDCYPALTGPRVGLVLQAEEYENRSGEPKQRMLIAAPFDADTRRMADEVLTSSPQAVALDKYLAWFESHKFKRAKPNGRVASVGNAPPTENFPDDDIPF